MTPRANHNSETMENAKRGEELNHLAGLLFIRSSTEWQWGILLSLLSGVAMVMLSESHGLLYDFKLILAFVALIIFGVAYYLRFVSEDTFETAETMRRQSSLSEGLGWPVNNRQFVEWKSRVGKQVLAEFKATVRPAGYWGSKATPGPRRLLEITIEAAFWTRLLYHKLRGLFFLALGLIAGIALLLICLSLIRAVPGEKAPELVSYVFLLLPAVLVFDYLEWILKLSRTIDAIKEVGTDLERLAEESEIPESQVLRLVSEYNSIVASGFPIHPWLYARWHDEIQELWDSRAK